MFNAFVFLSTSETVTYPTELNEWLINSIVILTHTLWTYRRLEIENLHAKNMWYKVHDGVFFLSKNVSKMREKN